MTRVSTPATMTRPDPATDFLAIAAPIFRSLANPLISLWRPPHGNARQSVQARDRLGQDAHRRMADEWYAFDRRSAGVGRFRLSGRRHGTHADRHATNDRHPAGDRRNGGASDRAPALERHGDGQAGDGRWCADAALSLRAKRRRSEARGRIDPLSARRPARRRRNASWQPLWHDTELPQARE